MRLRIGNWRGARRIAGAFSRDIGERLAPTMRFVHAVSGGSCRHGFLASANRKYHIQQSALSEVVELMNAKLTCFGRISILTALFAISAVGSFAASISTPVAFTAPMQIVDYRNSPQGLLADGVSMTNQYSAWGIGHDGSTTTPPGPAGMSSLSGLPGLESSAGDPDSSLPITLTFSRTVTQVGAYYLMGSRTSSITLTAFRANNTTIESVTVAPAEMSERPGPFGFNEGFIGLIVSEPIASVRFSPTSQPFVIDDVHVNVPEPSTLALLGTSIFCMAGRRSGSLVGTRATQSLANRSY